MEREINFTKYKLIPFINDTISCKVDEEKKEITVFKKENSKNLYKYSKLDEKEKSKFLFIKYLPVFTFIYIFITIYELQNHQLEIFLGFLTVSLGLLVNLRYKDDEISFVVSCVWFLFFCFITDIQNSAMIAKYTLINFLIYQFIFDLYRKYYSVFDKDNNHVSYAFFKRSKL